MTIAYIHHSDCLRHDMGFGHPERPARLTAIEDRLKVDGLFDFLELYEAPLAETSQIARIHDSQYIEHVLSFANKTGNTHLDPDTVVTPQSPQAALRAAGAALLATNLVLTNKVAGAFCGVRPPGHHALRNHAMGFCFFNNVAIGTAHALEEYGLERVAIVDFDVHHGNGTEAVFKNDPRVMLCSTFQYPFYPGSGANSSNEHIVNIPLPAGTESEAYREAVTARFLPALNRFKPQLIFFSAGFDAHTDDSLAQLDLVEADYEWITAEILTIADKYAQGRIISTLEGGYDLDALAHSVAVHLKVLMRQT
jgi:acetoin utilization deacetylase AcuC-like enzyme